MLGGGRAPINWADIEDASSVSSSRLSQGVMSIRTASNWEANDKYVDPLQAGGSQFSQGIRPGNAATLGDSSSKAMVWNVTGERLGSHPIGVPPPPPVGGVPIDPTMPQHLLTSSLSGPGPVPAPPPFAGASHAQLWEGLDLPWSNEAPAGSAVSTQAPLVPPSSNLGPIGPPSTGKVSPTNMAGSVSSKLQLVWCEAVAEEQMRIHQYLLDAGIPLVGEPLHFDAPTKFSRWLFEQPRGAVQPLAVLVSGWRETKPCAMALRAARSGEVGQLRPDARRPDLQPITGGPDCKVNLAIASMVITLRNPEQKERITTWVEQEGVPMTEMDVRVTCDSQSPGSLGQILVDSFRQILAQMQPPPGMASMLGEDPYSKKLISL